MENALQNVRFETVDGGRSFTVELKVIVHGASPSTRILDVRTTGAQAASARLRREIKKNFQVLLNLGSYIRGSLDLNEFAAPREARAAPRAQRVGARVEEQALWQAPAYVVQPTSPGARLPPTISSSRDDIHLLRQHDQRGRYEASEYFRVRTKHSH